jgi:hypothetical protein
MTGTRASTSVLALAACLVLPGALSAQAAHANDAGPMGGASADTIHFELPAKRLADALQDYGRMARVSVMAQTRLIEKLTSAPLNGDYPVRDALRRLLAGTGLTADYPSADEIIIVPLARSQQPSPAAPPAPILASTIDGATGDDQYGAYNAMVQTRLTEALCASPLTRPGSYRLVAQLRIGDTGRVVASKLLGSTGLPARDAAIEQTLHALVLDSAPPAALAQPVTILLRQGGNGVNDHCADVGVDSNPDAQG